MSLIHWNHDFRVGHTEIDGQHREMVSLYNRLGEGLLTGTGPRTKAFRLGILGELRELGHRHFALEEQLMKEAGYRHGYHHWRYHKDFAGSLYDQYRAVETGGLVLTSEILGLLRDKICRHMLVEDRKLFQAIGTRPPSRPEPAALLGAPAF